MLKDRYGNDISTSSQTARDAYIEGVDCVLSANHGAEDAFERAIEADPAFALAHASLARSYQLVARGKDAVEAMTIARQNMSGSSEREQSHIAALDHLVGGNGAAAYKAIVAHLDSYPRDAFAAQPCTSVFGLIGFSGVAGREAEMLAFMHRLAPHYGTDWWFDSLYAFAQVEAGQTDVAVETIERSLAANPRNANGAHIKSHIHYERGETKAGYDYISEWHKDFDKRAPLHCHISWHIALWALEQGDESRAWQVMEDEVMPDGAWGPPINILTDTASFLLRAEIAGCKPRPDLWKKISDYAAQSFPNTGLAFADVHAALAHAMAGNSDALEKVITDAKGPAGEVVAKMAEAYRSFARQDWADVIVRLSPTMSEHERIGGSRAQRDLIEFTYLNALLKLDRAEEAQRMIMMRRPTKVAGHPVHGLH